MVEEVRLARVFEDRALVVKVAVGHEKDVADMLLRISVPGDYPHHPIYYAMSKAVGNGISQIELEQASQIPQTWLVSPKIDR